MMQYAGGEEANVIPLMVEEIFGWYTLMRLGCPLTKLSLDQIVCTIKCTRPLPPTTSLLDRPQRPSILPLAMPRT
jgi:hypothetical protein